MIQDFIDKQFFRLYVITLYFGVIFYGLIGFQSIDELCGGTLFLLFLFQMFQTKDWEINKFFLMVLGIFLFYLCYSFCIQSNSSKAIIMDFIIQLKPYIAFFCVYQLNPLFGEKQKIILRQSCLICWLLLIPVGISGLLHPRIFTSMMGHASNYAAAITALALAFLYTSDNKLRNRLLFILLLAMGLVSGRSKFYGFFISASFIVLYFNHTKRWKISIKNMILFLALLASIVFVAMEKIQLYFLRGLPGSEENDYVARFVLYATSFRIFEDYFPFGSGFGSFATFASGVYYSPIYSEYDIDDVWGISKTFHDFIADTYYPSLAQFGVVGVIFFILFWVYLLKKIPRYMKATDDTRLTNIIMIVITYFTIENIADATFTSHRGLYFMMFMGILYAELKRKWPAA